MIASRDGGLTTLSRRLSSHCGVQVGERAFLPTFLVLLCCLSWTLHPGAGFLGAGGWVPQFGTELRQEDGSSTHGSQLGKKPCQFLLHFLFFLSFFFWLWHVACEILVPRSGIEPGPSEVKAQSPNHQTAREFPLTPCSLKAGLGISVVGLSFCILHPVSLEISISSSRTGHWYTATPERCSQPPCPPAVTSCGHWVGAGQEWGSD